MGYLGATWGSASSVRPLYSHQSTPAQLDRRHPLDAIHDLACKSEQMQAALTFYPPPHIVRVAAEQEHGALLQPVHAPASSPCETTAILEDPHQSPNCRPPKNLGWWKLSSSPIGAQAAQCGVELSSAHLKSPTRHCEPRRGAMTSTACLLPRGSTAREASSSQRSAKGMRMPVVHVSGPSCSVPSSAARSMRDVQRSMRLSHSCSSTSAPPRGTACLPRSTAPTQFISMLV
mmetsp:Transcript_6755/g.17531  ORF Transcript_6755/g.17531 Transcript_6755/m.17531 type:complete len:232 (+) Transcript_6755:81-776(+)